jgi:tol-pal system protein YbgF
MQDKALTPRFLALAACLILAGAAAPVHAFSDDEARIAINNLRQQVQQMNEQNQRARLQLADQIEALQKEIAQLRDQVETLSSRRPGNDPQPAAANNAPAVDPQEQAAYDGAIDLFRKGQYKNAADSLAAFAALYPNSDLTPSARFYLGSSRYALKDYKGAIAQLSSLVQDAPNDARAPDALLVIAGSQIELNNRAAARATLQKLVSQYPNAPAAATAKSRLQLLQ